MFSCFENYTITETKRKINEKKKNKKNKREKVYIIFQKERKSKHILKRSFNTRNQGTSPAYCQHYLMCLEIYYFLEYHANFLSMCYVMCKPESVFRMINLWIIHIMMWCKYFKKIWHKITRMQTSTWTTPSFPDRPSLAFKCLNVQCRKKLCLYLICNFCLKVLSRCSVYVLTVQCGASMSTEC